MLREVLLLLLLVLVQIISCLPIYNDFAELQRAQIIKSKSGSFFPEFAEDEDDGSNNILVVTKSLMWSSNDTKDICSAANCTAEEEFNPTVRCKSDSDWNKGVNYFEDPTPKQSVVRQINITIHGRFFCGNVRTVGIAVLVDSSFVGYQTIRNAKKGCACANCAVTLRTVISPKYPSWSNYQSQGNNTIQILATNGKVCISKTDISIGYVIPQDVTFSIATPKIIPIKKVAPVFIWGKGFFKASTWRCRFDNTTVTANFIDSIHINCTAPIEETAGIVALSFSSDGEKWISAGNITYYNEPALSSFYPAKGSPKRSAALNVTLMGTGFFDSEAMACKFGDNFPVLAIYVNESAVKCLKVLDTFHREAYVTVSYAQNFINFIDAPGKFQFTDATTPPNKPPATIPSPAPTPQTPSPATAVPIYVWVAGGALIAMVAGSLVVGLIIAKKRGVNESLSVLDDERAPLRLNSGSGKYVIASDINAIPISDIKNLELLEKGSFGVIYKGDWKGTVIAIKKLPSNNLSEKVVQEFLQEAEIMRSLRHPNVLQYLGTASHGREICICMEFMKLGSLYRLLHNPKINFSLEKLKSMAIQTARGMNYLHNQSPPIVHRDLKSHNLLVDEHFKVKVCDFGLSRFVDRSNSTMTACGTPSWTAPEVLRNEKYTLKADVYGFGVVVWEMLARKDPFPGMPPFQIVFAVGTQNLRPKLDTGWPTDWVSLITTCWDEDPNRRPTFDEILLRLEGLSTQQKFV